VILAAAPPFAGGPALRRRAFGLDLESNFEVLGVGGEPAHANRPLRLAIGSEAELRERWSGTEAECIFDFAGPDGERMVTIHEQRNNGFRFWAEHFGTAWLAGDGSQGLCVPIEQPAWRWQRYLVGQVLPFAAVLQGLEVFHASAVVVDGHAAAVVAQSGSGKTSVALSLALRGLPFLTDDVLILEPDDEGVTAHPGAGLANVRREDSDLVRIVEEARLGRALGETAAEIRMEVERHEGEVPLAAMFFLNRVPRSGRVSVERLSPVDPRLIFAGSFNLVLRHPRRLVRQLDVCARIARSAAIFSIDCPVTTGAAEVADQILDTIQALEAGPR
jgi:hypothetical protein